MSSAPTIHTDRLHLRLWRDEDLPAFGALNADPKVMEFFPKPLDRTESDATAARICDGFARRGFGLWAVEVPGVAPSKVGGLYLFEDPSLESRSIGQKIVLRMGRANATRVKAKLGEIRRLIATDFAAGK